MDTYVIILTIIGIAALAMAWLPQTFSNIPFSYPVVFILFGALLTFLPIELPVINISTDNESIIHLSELSVIVSLMGTGVKIDTRFGFKRWRVPLRLVTITMVLCILLMTLMGMYLLQLPLASALLLGAVLAPTDPVLASDVQVGPPNEKEENHVKFALTAEAGLNDGMAFPFTWLAILLAASGVYATTFQEWALEYVLMKIVIGTVAGFVLGKFISFLIFKAPAKWNFPEIQEGFVGLSATIFIYGATELVHGYGFLAVFIAALTLSRTQREHKYHRRLYHFVDQIERLLIVLLLIPLGASIAQGLLGSIGWKEILISIVFLLIIRPASGMLGLIGIPMRRKEKLTISFMGIRGIGTIYYLSFAFSKASFVEEDKLWAICGLIILISVIVHGITATPVMRYLEHTKQDEEERI